MTSLAFVYVLLGVCLTLFVLNLTLGVFNILKYLIPLKIGSPLVTLFYVCAIL